MYRIAGYFPTRKLSTQSRNGAIPFSLSENSAPVYSRSRQTVLNSFAARTAYCTPLPTVASSIAHSNPS